MGWARGGEIFDVVARGLVEARASDEIAERVCYQLAAVLVDGDWDTVDESVEAFEGHPVVQNALRCAAGRWELDYERGGFVDYDVRANQWVLEVGGVVVGRWPGTAEGHDDLLKAWEIRQRDL